MSNAKSHMGCMIVTEVKKYAVCKYCKDEIEHDDFYENIEDHLKNCHANPNAKLSLSCKHLKSGYWRACLNRKIQSWYNGDCKVLYTHTICPYWECKKSLEKYLEEQC